MKNVSSFDYQTESSTISRMQQLRFFPLAVESGAGNRLKTEDGRSLLDLSASWGAASLGHGHPAWVASIAQAARVPAGASLLSAAVKPSYNLAQRLLDMTPGQGNRRVWLGHSGSDANETVARAVAAATGRPNILAFVGAYHGGTAGSMAVSGHSAQEGVAKSQGLHLIPYPDPYRPIEADPTGANLLEHLKRFLAGPCPGETVAAFFIEPIQADGGVIVPPPKFLEQLSELCAHYGILTVCDEVKVGLARSGKLHCFEWEGFIPDILCLGKGLGGGLPISAAVGPEKILDHATAFSMQTLHGNPVSAAAATAVLDAIDGGGLVENARDVGAYFKGGLKSLAAKYDVIGEVRGRGLVIGVELVHSRETKAPAPELAAQVVYRAFELGAVLYYVGMNSNVLELTPPLTLTKAEVDEGLAILTQALDDIVAERFDTEKLKHFQGW